MPFSRTMSNKIKFVPQQIDKFRWIDWDMLPEYVQNTTKLKKKQEQGTVFGPSKLQSTY